MTYKVDDQDDNVEATGLSLPDAIRHAMASGGDVYIHSDDCTAEHELGPRCPCQPAKIPARQRRSNLRPLDRTVWS